MWFYYQDTLKPGYLKNLPMVLEQFSNFLGEGKWFAGDKVLFLLKRDLALIKAVLVLLLGLYYYLACGGLCCTYEKYI